MVKYSICSCHYNMVDTVELSLKSITRQVDDDFEVVVVDDGSDDGSLKVLRELDEKEDLLSLHELKPDEDRRLGETRNISIEKADGDYVMPQFDMDDFYIYGVIEDFIKIYHVLEDVIRHKFYLFGPNMKMAQRELLMEIPYDNDMPYPMEDRDLWDRLIDEGKFIGVQGGPTSFEIGYSPSIFKRVKIILSNFFEKPVRKLQLQRTSSKIDPLWLELSELEERFGVNIRDQLSNVGKSVFGKY